MAEVIKMPRMSDTMEEGVIVEWHKKVGDKVESGDILAEVETDKATMDLESYQDGTLLYIGVEKGDAVPVDAIMAVIGEEGEDYRSLLKEASEGTKEEKPEEPDKEESKESKESKEEEPEEEETAAKEEEETAAGSEEKEQPKKETSTSSDNSRLKASPLARSMAEDKGIDISQVEGTGDDGRIIKRDIENYKEKGPATQETKVATAEKVELPKIVAEESYEEVKVSQMRKTIARRLSESKFEAPHFYLTVEIEMDKTIEARKGINEVAPVKISFNDIIVKCVAAALRRHQQVNSSWLGDVIRLNHHIHIGVAVAVEEGLLVPVIRFADNKSLSHISQETKELAEKARNKKLQPEEMSGNTFTISNLGMFGIEEFTAIINPPDACILAVGGIRKVTDLNDETGEIRNKNVMKVTMSCDHRVVDGATGAKFLQTFKEYLEDPVRILVF